VLDQYWPGTTELSNIRRGDSSVYSAMCGTVKCIVKATPYTEEAETIAANQANYVNFLGETINVANYIEPYVAHSDSSVSLPKLVTVSNFVSGTAPEEVFGVSTIWLSD